MQHTVIHFSDDNENRLNYLNSLTKSSSNATEREKMKKILNRAILSELTDIQRLCVTEHFIYGKKQKELAKELGVNSSTVCRHINAAKRKLKNIASYYEI